MAVTNNLNCHGAWLDSALENRLDAIDENDEDFEVLEVTFTDKETDKTEERDEW